MQKPGIAAAAVLVIAVLGWWLLRAQHRELDEALVPAERSNAIAAAQTDRPLAASAAWADKWTQSVADAAWCNLKEPDQPTETEQLTPAQIEARQQESPGSQQLNAEAARLSKAWALALKQRGDERSQALADLVDGSAESLQHLTNLARHTTDPAVYAWALGKCNAVDTCYDLSARRWAQIDPGNQLPWLYEAANARRRNDEQGLREALYQIGQSSRSERYLAPMLQSLDGLHQATAPGLQMTAEWAISLGTMAPTFVPPFGAMTTYCAAAGTDPSRGSVCSDLAETLWAHSDTVVESSIALSISKRLPSRDAALWAARADERDALLFVKQQVFERPAYDSACALLPAALEQMKGLATVGEWGTLRARLAGRDVSALARKYREGNAKTRTQDNPASAAIPAR